jgi:hypothetical protein
MMATMSDLARYYRMLSPPRITLFALLCLARPVCLLAQQSDDKSFLEKQFPIILEITSSTIVNPEASNPDRLSQASSMGAAPPIFGFFRGTLSQFNVNPERESHWQFGCWSENIRFGQNPCVDMPIGLHRARWLHNREILEVLAYDSDGNSHLRYLDVTIDPKNPPPVGDPIESLPTFAGIFAIDAAQRDFPLLVHVYGAVALRFPAGELPARTHCDIRTLYNDRTSVDCTQYPPIPLSQGQVQIEASIDKPMPHSNLTCEAKWRWSKCSLLQPGFYQARWKTGDHSQIVLLTNTNGKREEVGFEIH